MAKEIIVVHGNNTLTGTVEVAGAKNSALKLIAASILARGECVLRNVPVISDIDVMSEVLEVLGATVHRGDEGDEHTLYVDTANIDSYETPYELVSKMRASISVLGPLIGRFGNAYVAMPGGCQIGARKIDMHLRGLESLGVEFSIDHGYLRAEAKNGLHGAHVVLDFPSVGATENIIMAASMAEGQTVLENPAQEPEIVDLANYLNVMGAKIRGAGTNVIKIEGQPKLRGRDYTIIPDRIEAGTYMVAAAMTRGDVYIENAISEHLKPVIAKLKEAGVTVEEDVNGIRVACDKRTKAVDIKTMPYPGFPTDMQAQFMAMIAVSEGTGMVTETVFENRFMHVDELKRMGAKIKIDGRTSVVEGVEGLTGCQVKATDLRAGAAMVLAGLVAEGETQVGYIHHIDRGYDQLVEKLVGLGADIARVDQ